jgi:hypothetical protein
MAPTRPPAGRAASARRKLAIPVGGGSTVIKLNVHPPGCRCGCASRGERSFVLNRPGEHVADRQTNDLDAVLRQTHEWALDALRSRRGAPAGGSSIQIGGGMTAILLSIRPDDAAPRLVVALPETDETRETDDLNSALSVFRQWAARAMDA